MAKLHRGNNLKREGFTVRCSSQYKAWLERMVAEHTEGTISHLVTRALQEYASRRGRKWESPPPRM